MKTKTETTSTVESKISKVKAHLIKNGSIQSFEAIELGYTRLSGGIFNLKANGWKFKTADVVLTDSHGVKAIYTKYILVSQPKKK